MLNTLQSGPRVLLMHNWNMQGVGNRGHAKRQCSDLNAMCAVIQCCTIMFPIKISICGYTTFLEEKIENTIWLLFNVGYI